VLNSTALKVMWRSLAPGRQHGQIRGYQVHYVRVANGESHGLPLIKDVMLADAQVEPPLLNAPYLRIAQSVEQAVSSGMPGLSAFHRLINVALPG